MSKKIISYLFVILGISCYSLFFNYLPLIIFIKFIMSSIVLLITTIGILYIIYLFKIRIKEVSLKTAIHETGHVFMAINADYVVESVTVIPDGDYSGNTKLKPEFEPKHDETLDDFHKRIKYYQGGRAAETVHYGAEKANSTHSKSDNRKAVNIGYNICDSDMDFQIASNASRNEKSKRAKEIFDEKLEESVKFFEGKKAKVMEFAEKLHTKKTLYQEEIQELLK